MHLELETIDKIFQMIEDDLKACTEKSKELNELKKIFYHTDLKIAEKKQAAIKEYFKLIPADVLQTELENEK